ncbi:MAG: M1 family aminopeptidase, partial [Gemmatimonadales bacterium]
MRIRDVVVPFALVLCALSPARAAGQQAAAPASAPERPLATYESRYAEVMGLAGDPSRIGEVTNLILTRDVARFTLKSGKMYLLTPVGGRTVAAVFRGEGVLSFSPPGAIEQNRLARFEQTKSLEAPFTDLVLLFADTTLVELQRSLTFAPRQIPGEVRARARESLEYLSDDDSRTVDPDLMSAFLNGDTTDLFYAHIRRSGGEPLMFMIDPDEFESVSLLHKVSARGWGKQGEVVCQFPARGRVRTTLITGERTRQAGVQRYAIEVSLPPTGIGELGFSAAARLEIVADTAVGPWVAFRLFEKLKVDSARWEGGAAATVFRGKESPLVWVRLDAPIKPGDVRVLTAYYHGDLIDRYGDFFYVNPTVAWYPASLEARTLSKFDLTFSTSTSYGLASVGELVDSAVTGRTVRSHWVTQGRIRNASFNLGLFRNYEVREPDIPPVTVMISEEAHKKLAREMVQQRKMRETVGADVSKSLRFFQSVYGPTSVKHFYATESPDNEGLAFPGMVSLSWVTFQNTSDQGDDELFRAHEVAHQWWGIGVDYETYHDRWLSEGFANFSGLWYMQTVRHDNSKYFGMLHRWRDDILARKDEPGPISLGHRVQAFKEERNDYQTIVYEKGAWVVHMLRILMLDLKTMNEDRFTETMQDFYRKFEGRRASTEDFRRVVERHTGADMGWFFNQWVYSTAIPTYHVSYRTTRSDDGQFLVKLRVVQQNVPED